MVVNLVSYVLGLSGDAHFDDDETFTTGEIRGVNLDWVAVHEFGHSLGLEHSNVRGSIMYPWYQGYKPNIKLTDDDILGIQGIYGELFIALGPLGSSYELSTPTYVLTKLDVYSRYSSCME